MSADKWLAGVQYTIYIVLLVYLIDSMHMGEFIFFYVGAVVARVGSVSQKYTVWNDHHMKGETRLYKPRQRVSIEASQKWTRS